MTSYSFISSARFSSVVDVITFIVAADEDKDVVVAWLVVTTGLVAVACFAVDGEDEVGDALFVLVVTVVVPLVVFVVVPVALEVEDGLLVFVVVSLVVVMVAVDEVKVVVDVVVVVLAASVEMCFGVVVVSPSVVWSGKSKSCWEVTSYSFINPARFSSSVVDKVEVVAPFVE